MARSRNSSAKSEQKKRTRGRSQVIQPSTRVYQTWTPARIRAVELSADSGNLREVARLCDWLLGDEEIQGGLHTRVQALLGLNPTFIPAGDKRRKSRVIRLLKNSDWWPSYPENELAQIHTWGLIAGYCPGRHQWLSPEGYDGRLLPNPEFWHPQHLRLDWNTRQWMIRTISADAQSKAGAGTEQVLTPGDSEWLLHMPYGVTRPWSLGLWRGLSRWALLKAYAVADLGRLGESVTRNVVEEERSDEYNDASAKDLRQELADDIAQLGRDGTLVLPTGFSYKLVQTSASTHELFKLQVTLANTAIAIAIRGGNLTTNTGQSGSRAAAEVQERLGDKAKLRFDAQSLSTFIHDQSLIWWAEFNFGTQAVTPWPKYPVDPKEDTKVKAESMDWAAVAASKWVALGYELDREAFAEAFDVAEFLTPTEGPASKPVEAQGQDDGETVDKDDEDREESARGAGQEKAGAGDSKVNSSAKGRDIRGALAARLASGAQLRGNEGFLSGQLYADKLVDEATPAAVAALAPVIDGIIEDLDAAEDYEDLRQRLHARYEGLNPDELNRLVYQTMLLGNLAGRAAVNEDS